MENIGYRIGSFVCRNKIVSATAALISISLIGGLIVTGWQARRVAKVPAQSANVRPVDHSVDYRDTYNYLLNATRSTKEPASYDGRRDVADLHNVALGMESDVAPEEGRKTPDNEPTIADSSTNRPPPIRGPVWYDNARSAFFLSGNPDVLNRNNGDYLALVKKQPQAALEAFRNKLAIDEQLIATDPGNTQVQGDLAYARSRIGDLLAEAGDNLDAVPYYQRAVEVLERGAATGQQDLATALKLSQVLGKLAQTHAKLGYIEKARAECKKATDLLQSFAEEGNNLSQRHLRALAYNEIADAYALVARDARTPQQLMKESWRSARDLYQRSLEILNDLRDRGVLDQDGLTLIDNLTQKIAEADMFLGKQ